MKECENCNETHEGSYGSGRFCGSKCARGFSTKDKRKDINKKISEANHRRGNGNVTISCECCNKQVEKPWNRRHQKFCSVSCARKKHMNTTESKEFYSELAKKTGIGGNRNKYAHGYYESKFAGRVYLESSYEYRVALELDNNNIKWSRPKPLKYGDKKYYPDFYLIEQDVYLDPKNDYLITIDTDKIRTVEKENNVVILILDKDNLTWSDISDKIK